MPIGKNSIKRVKNNGYSQVVSAAPDMENSTVVSSPSPEALETVTAAAKASKSTKKSTPVSKKTTEPKKKATETKPTDVKKRLPKLIKTEKKDTPEVEETLRSETSGLVESAKPLDPAKTPGAPKAPVEVVSFEKKYVNLGGTPLHVHLL